MSFLRNPRKTANILFFYWIITAGAFVLYQFYLQSDTGNSFSELLSIPGIVLAFVAACLNVILAAALRYLTNPDFAPALTIVLVLLIIQQLVVANIPGAFFCGLLLWQRPLWPTGDNHVTTTSIVAVSTFVGFVTVIVAIAQVNFYLG